LAAYYQTFATSRRNRKLREPAVASVIRMAGTIASIIAGVDGTN